MPEPIEVEDEEIDLPDEPDEPDETPDVSPGERRPGLLERLRREAARRLREAADRIRQ